MKKFILEITALLLLLIISLCLLYFIDPPWRVSKLKEVKGKLEITNLGTSHGWDFDYNNCPMVGMNFNFSGNTLYYDLQNYLFLEEEGYLADHAIIIIPVSYFVFGLDENRTDGNVGAFVNQFYDYLPPRYIYDYSIRTELELATDKIQQDLYARIKKLTSGNQPSKQTQTANSDTLETVTERLERLGEERAERHLMLSSLNPPEKNEAYLETLVQDILADGNTPVLVTVPHYSSYTSRFPAEWLEKEYFSRMRYLADKYNLLYLDYHDDRRFVIHPEYYGDADHLNEDGKVVFNELFIEDIGEIIRRR